MKERLWSVLAWVAFTNAVILVAQRRSIALMALELKRARYAAYAAEKALTTALEVDVIY